MLIDIHTHVFPPQLAEKALQGMIAMLDANYESYRIRFRPRADGTVTGLLQTMEKSGCTHSVLCPVITNPKSTQKTNEYAMAQRCDKITPLAGFLPTQDGWEGVLEEIAAQGFPGIKIHPEYQNLDIDSPRCIEVIKRAEALGLAVLFHAGKDPGYPPPIHASATQIVNLLEHVDGKKLIAAHMGGWMDWENVEKYLLDAPICFDTACIAGYIAPEFCKHLMRAHGTDKILFGSDYPWQTSGDVLSFIQTLGLTDGEMEQICWKNASALLGINAKRL